MTRPLAGTEDLDDSVARQTYADLIGTAYETATAVVIDGTVAAVDVVENTITETAHGFETGDKVVYTNGGGTSITGLTSTNTYYVIRVDANTIQLASSYANAIAGTEIDLTVVGVGTSQVLTPTITATFLANTSGTAIVELKAPAGVELTAVLSDSVVFTEEESTTCTPTAGSTVAWVATNGVGYRATRDLCISLNRNVCTDGNRLAELQAFYLNNPLYVAGSLAVVAGDDCRDSYTLTQLADGFSTDGCLSTEPGVFSDFGGYEGQTWEVVEEEADDFDDEKRCGLEITAEIPEKYYSDCAMELKDYWEDEPIRLEVAWIHDSYTGFPDICALTFPSAKRTQVGQVANQSGEWLLREYIKL